MMPSEGELFQILKKGILQSEWTLAVVLEHVSRASLLSQDLSLWLWDGGAARVTGSGQCRQIKQRGTYRHGPLLQYFNNSSVCSDAY